MNRIKIAIFLHVLLVLLELIALAHDIEAFGAGLFQYYTIDSNVLMMLVSAVIAAHLIRRGGEPVPAPVQVLHLTCAVCLTITFFIALLVLAPQEGFAYYFLSDVAPINHFLGAAFSVTTFLFFEKPAALRKTAVLAPMAASLLYGVIALVLNAVRVLDGPYFFLRVYDEAPGTIALWFGIIAALCLGLSALYLWLRSRYWRRHAA